MDKNLQEAIRKAHQAVNAINIEDSELRKIAFSKAIDYVLYHNKEEVNAYNSVKGNLQSQDFWNRLHIASGTEINYLRDVYSLKDNFQILLVTPTISGKTKSEQQKNFAILILFAYHEGLGREWVSAGLLAEAAKHSNLYDTSSFAKSLKGLWFRSQGVKKGLQYKLSSIGIDVAKKSLAVISSNK